MDIQADRPPGKPDTEPRPRLSIVLATTDAWPDLAACLDVLEPQARACDAELIIGDGDGAGLPDDYASNPERILWLRRPGASVFTLRAEAVTRARGEIIAVTEDHCVVAPDWCARILQAHEEHPDTLGVAGAIENGSPDSIVDWANYLQTFGAFAPPVNPRQRERAPLLANLSLKRGALPEGTLQPGALELDVVPRVFAGGGFTTDDRIVVSHVQSHGVVGTLLAHFHNGRVTTGFSTQRLSRRQLPFRVFRSTLRTLRGKTALRRRLFPALPYLLLLSAAHATGEAMGILAGPGRSPEQLR